MTRTDSTTTRRTLLAGIAAIPAMGAAGAIALAPAHATGGAEWYVLKRRYDQAKAAYDADCIQYDRISDACTASRPSLDMIDWRELSILNGFGHERYRIAHTMDVEAEWRDFLNRENKTWWAPDPVRNREVKARRRAALDSVLEYRGQDKANDRHHGIDEATERNEALSDQAHKLEKALVQMPAPDLPALGWKIEHLWGDHQLEQDYSDSIGMDWIKPIVDDARRLLSEGRA